MSQSIGQTHTPLSSWALYPLSLKHDQSSGLVVMVKGTGGIEWLGAIQPSRGLLWQVKRLSNSPFCHPSLSYIIQSKRKEWMVEALGCWWNLGFRTTLSIGRDRYCTNFLWNVLDWYFMIVLIMMLLMIMMMMVKRKRMAMVMIAFIQRLFSQPPMPQAGTIICLTFAKIYSTSSSSSSSVSFSPLSDYLSWP